MDEPLMADVGGVGQYSLVGGFGTAQARFVGLTLVGPLVAAPG